MDCPKWKKKLGSILNPFDRLMGASTPILLALGVTALSPGQAVEQEAAPAPPALVLLPTEISKYSKKYVLKSVRMPSFVRNAAQHVSHASHSSHASHASHYSGASSPAPKSTTPSPTYPSQPTRKLTGDFNESSRLWRVGVMSSDATSLENEPVVVAQLGRVEISPRANIDGPRFRGYLTSDLWNLSGAKVSVRVVQTANGTAETIFGLASDSRNWYRFDERNGVLELQSSFNGVRSLTTIPYDSRLHRFWRLRHDGTTGMMIWETSSDGLTWVVRHAVTAELSVAALYVELSAGTQLPIQTPGKAVFDTFQVESPIY